MNEERDGNYCEYDRYQDMAKCEAWRGAIALKSCREDGREVEDGRNVRPREDTGKGKGIPWSSFVF